MLNVVGAGRSCPLEVQHNRAASPPEKSSQDNSPKGKTLLLFNKKASAVTYTL